MGVFLLQFQEIPIMNHTKRAKILPSAFKASIELRCYQIFGNKEFGIVTNKFMTLFRIGCPELCYRRFSVSEGSGSNLRVDKDNKKSE